MNDPAPLSKAIVAVLIGYIFAVCWVIAADIIYNNNVPLDAFEFHGLYPMGLAVSAIAVALIYDRNLRSLGMRKTGWKYMLLPVMIVAILYVIPALVNVTANIFANGKNTEPTGTLVVALPVILLLALAEEVMWRGMVYDTLSPRYSTIKTAIIIGICWTLWHYPVIIHTHFIYADRPLWYALFAFTINVMGLSVIYTWLRKASGSIWPCVLIHGLSNYMGFALIEPMEVPLRPFSPFFKSDIGIPYVLATLTIAVYIFRQARYNRSQPSNIN